MSALPGRITHDDADAKAEAATTEHDAPSWGNVPAGTDLLGELQRAIERARERQGRA